MVSDHPHGNAPRFVGRYRLGALIGRGGMGEVYRAWDPELGRWVAVKILTTMTDRSKARFAREARAQIALEHPMVCPVHEVGEQDGRPYIVMQLIEGQPLLEAAAGMTLEELVMVFIDVAETLHTAHARGFIHRDVKPSNILVERMEDRWHPWLVDFGLVAARGAEELTRSDEALGTPVYMAPEQVLGSGKLIDRRADVYSLGATLYCVLTGRLPFGEGHPVEIMARVTAGDLQPPRVIVPSLPADLEAVVLKAMEVAPERRYASARDLANDLQRFLDGEPVEARQPSVLWRFRRLWRRHPRLSAALTVLLAGGIVGGTLLLRAHWRAREVARLATTYGREAAAIEADLRMAAMLPLHDIRPEREAARHRLDAIERSMRQRGKLARGPGEVALGRGELALGHPERALTHLQHAWNDGMQEPEVAWLLGRTLSAVYAGKLDKVRADSGREALERLRPELERRYRDPALTYLRIARNWNTERTLYVESLIAFDEKQFDDALRVAAMAADEAPGFFEARRFVGEILIERSRLRFDSGKHELAEADIGRAIDELKRARVVARSGPKVHDALCEAGALKLSFATIRGTMQVELLHSAEDLCREALVVDPGNVRTLHSLARLYRYWAMWLVDHGKDATAAYAAAEEAARDAVQAVPDSAACHAMLGKVLMDVVKTAGGTNEAIEDRWLETISELGKAIEIEPGDSAHWNNRGLARWRYARWLQRHGGEWLAMNDLAAADLRKATDLDPRSFQAWTNLGGLLLSEAIAVSGTDRDILSSLDSAQRALEQAVTINPRSPTALNTLGATGIIMAQERLERGLDPSEPLKKGIAALRRSFEENPSNHRMYNNLAAAYLLLGSSRIEAWKDPGDAFERGFELMDRALELNPNDVTALINRAEGHWWLARWQLQEGRDGSSELTKAQASLQRARTLREDHGQLRSLEGRLALTRARLLAVRGEDPTAALDQAEAATRFMLEHQQTSQAARRLAAGIAFERARWQRTHDGPWRQTLEEVLSTLTHEPDQPEKDPRLQLLLARLEAEFADGLTDPPQRSDLLASAHRRLRWIHDHAPLLATPASQLLADLPAAAGPSQIRSTS